MPDLIDESFGVNRVPQIEHCADEFESENHEDTVCERIQLVFLEHMQQSQRRDVEEKRKENDWLPVFD